MAQNYYRHLEMTRSTGSVDTHTQPNRFFLAQANTNVQHLSKPWSQPVNLKQQAHRISRSLRPWRFGASAQPSLPGTRAPPENGLVREGTRCEACGWFWPWPSAIVWSPWTSRRDRHTERHGRHMRCALESISVTRLGGRRSRRVHRRSSEVLGGSELGGAKHGASAAVGGCETWGGTRLDS